MTTIAQAAIPLLISIALTATAHAAPNCEKLDNDASHAGEAVPGCQAIRKVTGTGRLQFYSAPDPRCKMPGVFIIPGDTVVAYVDHKGYTSVMYASRDNSVMGWVESRRLKETGTGISPCP